MQVRHFLIYQSLACFTDTLTILTDVQLIGERLLERVLVTSPMLANKVIQNKQGEKFALKLIDFALKLMDFALKLMDFVLKLMDFPLKLMDFPLKMTISPTRSLVCLYRWG